MILKKEYAQCVGMLLRFQNNGFILYWWQSEYEVALSGSLVMSTVMIGVFLKIQTDAGPAGFTTL